MPDQGGDGGALTPPSPSPSLGRGYCDEEPSREQTDTSGGRRVLLVIYIHGYMGKDSSFQSFPAHVHDLLKMSLDTHIIHTKIYPRYKTYKAIDVARDNFSRWLAPHESPTTDIVLVGHSMGGLLAADTALLSPHQDEAGKPCKLRHRILGILSLDSPFLGLHPGIISAGIASLFRKGPDSQKSASSQSIPDANGKLSPDPSIYNDLVSDMTSSSETPESSTAALSYFPSNNSTSLSTTISPGSNPAAESFSSSNGANSSKSRPDPYYNPPFFNDIMFKDRGWMKNMWHFAKKRKIEGSSLIEAATNHIVCHLQFGKALTDHRGLHVRYQSIRRLEDVNDLSPPEQPERNASGGGGGGGRRGRNRDSDGQPHERDVRVRFVNYYTISTGRAKTKKSKSLVQSPTRSPARSPVRSTASSPGPSPPSHSQARSHEGSPPRSPLPIRPHMQPPPPDRRLFNRPVYAHERRSPPSVPFLKPEQQQKLQNEGPKRDGSLELPDSRSSTPRISIEDHSNTARPKLLEIIYSDRFDNAMNVPYATPNSEGCRKAVGPSDLSTESSGSTPGTDTGSSPDGEGAATATSYPPSTAALSSQAVAATPVTKSAAAPAPAPNTTAPDDNNDDLAPISELPPPPQEPRLAQDADADMRRKAEKEHRRAMKSYDQAVKAREKALKDREKTLERRRRKAEKEALRRERGEARMEKKRLRKEEGSKGKGDFGGGCGGKGKEGEEDGRKSAETAENSMGAGTTGSARRVVDCSECVAAEDFDGQQERRQAKKADEQEDLELRQAAERVVISAGSGVGAGAEQPRNQKRRGIGGDNGQQQQQEKAKKPRKFCTLPKKVNGVRDSAWVEVFMEGVDEIGAHTGLFVPGAPHYEKLVGDVGSRIVAWVQEDASRRAVVGDDDEEGEECPGFCRG